MPAPTYSPAPNEQTLFKQQYYVEKAISDFLKAPEQGIPNVYLSRSSDAQVTPRVEVTFTMGKQGVQVKLFNGRRVPAAHEFMLELTVTTSRNDDTQDHDDMVAAVLWYMSAAKAFTDANMPYHQIPALNFAGYQQAQQADREADMTVMQFVGTIAIRNEAWPVPTP